MRAPWMLRAKNNYVFNENKRTAKKQPAPASVNYRGGSLSLNSSRRVIPLQSKAE